MLPIQLDFVLTSSSFLLSPCIYSTCIHARWGLNSALTVFCRSEHVCTYKTVHVSSKLQLGLTTFHPIQRGPCIAQALHLHGKWCDKWTQNTFCHDDVRVLAFTNFKCLCLSFILINVVIIFQVRVIKLPLKPEMDHSINNEKAKRTVLLEWRSEQAQEEMTGNGFFSQRGSHWGQCESIVVKILTSLQDTTEHKTAAGYLASPL